MNLDWLPWSCKGKMGNFSSHCDHGQIFPNMIAGRCLTARDRIKMVCCNCKREVWVA